MSTVAKRSPISATAELLYKSSAVAEMGDRGYNRHGPKKRELLFPFRGELGVPV